MDPIQLAIREATDLAAPPQRELAGEAGISPLTLSLWRNGHRHPTPTNLGELGRVLLQRARRLEKVASELIWLAQQLNEEAPDTPPVVADDEALDFFEPEVVG